MAAIGKPCGQDVRNDRPNAVRETGVEPALARLHAMIGSVIGAIPECSGSDMLRSLILSEAKRLVPVQLSSTAA